MKTKNTPGNSFSSSLRMIKLSSNARHPQSKIKARVEKLFCNHRKTAFTTRYKSVGTKKKVNRYYHSAVLNHFLKQFKWRLQLKSSNRQSFCQFQEVELNLIKTTK